MNVPAPLSFLRHFWLGVSLLCTPFAVLAECENRYFSIDSQGIEHPIRHPSPALAQTMAQAKAGDATAQRNLAISYETGYLVSPCRSQSIRWYHAAADSGDEAAKQWLRRNEPIAALRSGPECGEASCRNASQSDAGSAVLYADSRHNNHYFAPLTINGRSARGMIDTGASTIAMSAEMARMYGIDTTKGATTKSSTANGQIPVTLVMVPVVDVAGIRLHNVAVSVGISDGILIGMSFLNRMNITVGSGTMTLSRK